MGAPNEGLFFRTALEDHNICDIRVKKGTQVKTHNWANMFDSKIYENPDEFNPSRWIDRKSEYEKMDPFKFLPFSGGARNCIGQHLAILETKINLILFLLTFEFKIPEDYDMIWQADFLVEPKNKLIFELNTRNNSIL